MDINPILEQRRQALADLEHLQFELDYKNETIENLVNQIRSIYSIAGEDKLVAELCNEILEDSRYI